MFIVYLCIFRHKLEFLQTIFKKKTILNKKYNNYKNF
jgi:hypothetical protein